MRGPGMKSWLLGSALLLGCPLLAANAEAAQADKHHRPLHKLAVSSHVHQISTRVTLKSGAHVVSAMHMAGKHAQMRSHVQMWRDVGGMTDPALANLVRTDRIDILVDLTGHTGSHRLLAFAQKPAPIQMTWMGYVNTTGLKAMDYILTDSCQTPEGSSQHYTEKVVRMPHDYVCYRPQEDSPDVAPLPALAGIGFTFGCFNNLAKVNDQVLSAWATILQAVPGSRLLMMTHSLGDSMTNERVRASLVGYGVETERLHLQPAASPKDVLKWYNKVDLALDSFPYVGGLTTIEALWMGVPTVTLAGVGIAGRHSVSHLSNCGLSEFITGSVAEYCDLAVRIAKAPEQLGQLRAGLRARMAAGPLLDWAGFTQSLEEHYRTMWHTWCRSVGC